LSEAAPLATSINMTKKSFSSSPADGVRQAGHSFREELRIFMLIFALPAAIAILAK
jgi:hypothetical protein